MEKISVTIRVRPLSKAEVAKGSPWKLGPNSIALCNASSSTISGQSYTFDRVFGSEATTLEIYEAQTKDIIVSAVQGFNGTVFAYGQTSSGKTFTMRGSPQEPGIIPLAVYEVFQNIQAVNSREFLLRVSYMEIYNEEINDLLAPEAQKLQIHESAERGIFVAGLREEIVVSPEQVLELMEFGENHRHVGETNMNVYSSRSHTIFRMVIESRDRSQDDPYGNTTVQACDAVRVSVLNLVDLAGSERVAKTGAEGARLKEGTHINKSLMTLGTVINKLSEGIQKQGGHVPYRDSKLTRILQPALGGNAKTAVICNVTPALVHADETKGTLYFASRANRVTNCAQVNEIMTDAALLKRQKKEIEELRAKLQESHSEHWEEEVLNLRNALLKTELDRERMALELQEEKKAQADRERRLKEQEQKIENLSTMVINSAVDDRDFDKRSKKNNRRETWCPRIPAEAPDDVEHQEMKRPFSKEVPWAPFGVSVLPMRRERLQCLPPPFEKLCEEEDTMLSSWKEEDNGGLETLKASHDSDDIFLSATLHVGERRRRSAADKEATMEQEISNLQAQYDDLQCDNEIKMWEKMIEIEELKKELAHAQMAASKARKLDDKCQQVPEVERRVGTLGSCDVDSGFKQLRAQNLEMEKSYMQQHLGGLNQQAKCQSTTAKEHLEELQNLELEKISMQQELGSLTEQVKFQATAAEDSLDKVKKELHESMKEAAAAQYELNLALQKIESLEKENEKGVEVQRELVSSIDELKCEVEAIMSTTDFASLGEIRQFFAPYLLELEQAQQEVATEKTHLVQKGETMQAWIQVLEGERDALIETTKQIQADMDRLQGMHRQELKESQKKLELALSDNVGVVEQLRAMDSFLAQKKAENQMLEQKLQAVQAENESSRTALQARASEWDMTQHMHAEEKLLFKQKEEDFLSCLQLVEGEREALMKKSEQAEAEIGCLCRELDSQSQELVEAERRLEFALSEQEKVVKELSDVQIQLTAQVEEQNLLRLLLAELEAQKDAMERCLAAEEGHDAINGDLGNTKPQLFATECSLKMKPMELKKDAGLQFLKDSNTMHKHSMSEAPAVVELEEKLAESAHLSAVLNQEKEIATETAKRAAEESASFRLRLEVLEHEHALLVEKLDKSEASLQSAEAFAVEAVREIEKLTQELEAISAENIGAKAELETLQQEKLAFLKDKDTMEAALAFAEKERITFKEKNDEAQEELNALDEELERQRQENEEAVSVLGLAKSADAQAAVVVKELQVMLSEREEKQQFLEHQIANFKVQAAAANADLESRTCELQVIQKKLDLASSECSTSRAQIAEMDTLISQKNATLEVLTGDMLNLERQFAATKQELAVRVHQLEESVSKISEEKLVLLNKQELQQSTLREVEGERDELISSSEVLQQDINVLTEKMEHQESQQTDMISKFEALKFEFERQQLELHELESKLTHANSEIDDREEQLRGVHCILLENSKERKLLEEKLAKLEVEKCAMENTLAEGEAQLLAQRAAMTEATSNQEVQQQLHFTEAAQLRSDILALRKELNAAKSAPATLEKERDGLAKELEKLKIKMKDIEAKLKSTLVEKSKLEAEKVNIDREMKQLRQSTVLLNKRESIVDKRRESIATGLTKTKAQLSSAEHALQMKTVELEKSSFDLQLLQDSYAKLEFAMSEMECGSITLKEKLAESEKSITILGQEKETAVHNMEKVAEELKVALEQQRVTVGDLEALQAVHLSLLNS
ncbi:hypothetical protein BDL97_02G001200 [Sphagnum fallax]|nr:hypothetical protein BDL97_02G001200 [Sphagnum fallax]